MEITTIVMAGIIGVFIGVMIAIKTGKAFSIVFSSIIGSIGAYKFYIAPSLGLPVIPEMLLIAVGGSLAGFWLTKLFMVVL